MSDFYAIGNDELTERPSIPAGASIRCSNCNGSHTLEKSESGCISVYRCGNDYYLAGIDGKLVPGVVLDSASERH